MLPTGGMRLASKGSVREDHLKCQLSSSTSQAVVPSSRERTTLGCPNSDTVGLIPCQTPKRASPGKLVSSSAQGCENEAVNMASTRLGVSEENSLLPSNAFPRSIPEGIERIPIVIIKLLSPFLQPSFRVKCICIAEVLLATRCSVIVDADDRSARHIRSHDFRASSGHLPRQRPQDSWASAKGLFKAGK